MFNLTIGGDFAFEFFDACAHHELLCVKYARHCRHHFVTDGLVLRNQIKQRNFHEKNSWLSKFFGSVVTLRRIVRDELSSILRRYGLPAHDRSGPRAARTSAGGPMS